MFALRPTCDFTTPVHHCDTICIVLSLQNDDTETIIGDKQTGIMDVVVRVNCADGVPIGGLVVHQSHLLEPGHLIWLIFLQPRLIKTGNNR